MSETDTYFALKLTTPELAEVASYVDPTIRGKHFETVIKDQVLILGFPSPGRYSLVLPRIFEKNFDVVEGSEMIGFSLYAKKFIDRDPLRKTYIPKED